ncbi:hypothetical protein PLESTF_000937400 [Pleodorina starrii]|nr:hypothetical protein PLESTF_000937400 [Pleodorina starrii]
MQQHTTRASKRPHSPHTQTTRLLQPPSQLPWSAGARARLGACPFGGGACNPLEHRSQLHNRQRPAAAAAAVSRPTHLRDLAEENRTNTQKRTPPPRKGHAA